MNTLLAVFSFDDYRDYLKQEFSGTGKNRGRRSLLSAHLRCQTSFLSQVLTDRAHLSLEHAIQTSEFLNHNDSEKKYFMLLVQKGKSGSRQLERFYTDEILRIKREREKISERINIRSNLTAEDQMRYYSAWYFAAIHVLTAIPGFNSVESIASKLKLDVSAVKRSLQFLEERGFVKSAKGSYQIGATRIHLPGGSPMLPRHHANWRMKATESVDQVREGDLHYSAVLGISKRDQKKFHEKLLELIQEFEPTIKSSPEEIPVILLMDLFEL